MTVTGSGSASFERRRSTAHAGDAQRAQPARPAVLEQVTRDVLIGRGTAVNWVLLREGRDLTLIDAGYPRDAGPLVAALERIGHRLDDVAAVLVTHAHVDHVGGIPALLGRRPIPVLASAQELPNAHGDVHEQATPFDVVRHSWRPRGARWLASIVRAGGGEHVRLASALPFPQDGALDVPGRPVPIASGGHTSGHTAFLVPEEGMIATGDAMVTAHPLSAFRGPQLLPDFFSANPAAAYAALTDVAAAPADIVLPGHGDVWRGDLAVAAEQARATLLRAGRRPHRTA